MPPPTPREELENLRAGVSPQRAELEQLRGQTVPLSERGIFERLGVGTAKAGRAVAEGAFDVISPFTNAAAGTMNLGIQAANLIPGVDIERRFPEQSQAFSQALTQAGVPELEGTAENIIGGTARFATSMLGGAGLTTQAMRRLGITARPTPVRQPAEIAQQQGYVIPPSTTRPGPLTGIIEGVAGKVKTAQIASIRNQDVTNRAASRAVGLSEDVPITTESLEAVRAQAGQAYSTIRNVGLINADTKFRRALSEAIKPFRSTSRDFPKLAQDDVIAIADDLNQPGFDSNSAMDAIDLLRDKADGAFRIGASRAGRAYRAMSNALEDAIERDLVRQGVGEDIVQSFRNARTDIARTYTVQNALVGNNVSAVKLGQQLSRGRPLTGELRQAAMFAQQFPKAARTIPESVPTISPLDVYAAGGITAASGNPLPLGIPFLRGTARSFLLSRSGQRLAVPSTGVSAIPGRTLGPIATTSAQLQPERQ